MKSSSAKLYSLYISFACAFICLFGCSPGYDGDDDAAEQNIAYGADSREYVSGQSETLRRNVGILVELSYSLSDARSNVFCPTNQATCRVKTALYKNILPIGIRNSLGERLRADPGLHPLCSDERFFDDRTILNGFCSGSLLNVAQMATKLGPDNALIQSRGREPWLLTAGHCLLNRLGRLQDGTYNIFGNPIVVITGVTHDQIKNDAFIISKEQVWEIDPEHPLIAMHYDYDWQPKAKTFSSWNHDHAVLGLKTSSYDTLSNHLGLLLGGSPALNQSLQAFGYPETLAMVRSTGAAFAMGDFMLEHTVDEGPGFSGGPITSDDERLVAITSKGPQPGRDYCLATPSSAAPSRCLPAERDPFSPDFIPTLKLDDPFLNQTFPSVTEDEIAKLYEAKPSKTCWKTYTYPEVAAQAKNHPRLDLVSCEARNPCKPRANLVSDVISSLKSQLIKVPPAPYDVEMPQPIVTSPRAP